MRRQAFQSALQERGLDPFLGSKIQDHVAFVQGLEPVMFERYSVPLTANHSGTCSIPGPLLKCRSLVVVPQLLIYPDLGLVRSIRQVVIAGSWTVRFRTTCGGEYPGGGRRRVVLVL